MIILPQVNIKLIQILGYRVKDILTMKLKNIVICGGKVANFQQKNIHLIKEFQNIKILSLS